MPPSPRRSQPYSRAGPPSPTPTQDPTPDSGTSAEQGPFESWSVTTTICLLSARSIPTIACVTGTSSRSRFSLAFLLRSPRETPLPLLIERPPLRIGTPSPSSASGGRSYVAHRHAEC